MTAQNLSNNQNYHLSADDARNVGVAGIAQAKIRTQQLLIRIWAPEVIRNPISTKHFIAFWNVCTVFLKNFKASTPSSPSY